LAKNITIAEGGVGRNFGPTKKLETDLQGGGTQLWIPEDEANDYASKEPLNVTANGTYTPSTAVGLNPVTVEVPIHLGTRPTITENGDYNAQDEGLDGYTGVTVNVDNVAHLGIGSTTANGTYTASDYEYDGFSVFTVNVPAIDGEGYKVTPDEENSLVVIEDTTEDLSGIYGTSVDTETGSMYTVTNEDGEAYLVQVDTDGAVTKTLFPCGMEIVTPPTKTSYTEGETMDYTGIQVKLLTKSGTYTDDVYTTGVIPFAELEFPVSVAPHGEGGEGEATGGSIICYGTTYTYTGEVSFFDANDAAITGQYRWGYESAPVLHSTTVAYATDAVYCCCYYTTNNYYRFLFFSKAAFGIVSSLNRSTTSQQSTNDATFSGIIDGKPVWALLADSYVNNFENGTYSVECPVSDAESILSVSPSPPSGFLISLCETIWLYGGTIVTSTADIPVQWAAPQPHFPVKAKFQEYFEIEVTDSE